MILLDVIMIYLTISYTNHSDYFNFARTLNPRILKSFSRTHAEREREVLCLLPIILIDAVIYRSGFNTLGEIKEKILNVKLNAINHTSIVASICRPLDEACAC